MNDEARATLIETIGKLMHNALQDERGEPIPCTAPVVEIIDGPEAAPAVYIAKGWLDQAHRDREPDEPLIRVDGWPEGYTPPDDDDFTEASR